MNSLLSILGILLALYIAMVVALAVFQRALMYHPTEDAPPIPSVLADRGEALRVPGHDGVQLHTWWVPPAQAGNPVIVYFHGNAGTQADRYNRAIGFATLGYGVLMPTYRYNAAAGGEPSEEALIADGEAVLDWAFTQGVAPSQIVLFGESLGTGVAVALAGDASKVAGIILDSPFDSIAAVAARRYWFAPVNWLLRDRFDSDRRIRDVTVPLLIGHGARDRLIPLSHGQALFDTANEPKTLVVKPEGGHIQLFEYGFAADIQAFMGRLQSGKQND